jgi:hypothetical protein
MAEEGEAPPYAWTSTEPLLEGAEEAPAGAWVQAAGKAKVAYPNGDAFEGAFNEALQKHGRGVYTWSTAAGANPWVPEGEGFAGEAGRRRRARARSQRERSARAAPRRARLQRAPLMRAPPPHPPHPHPLFPEGKAPTVKYEGQYVEGRKHGVGKLALPNGDRYHGSFAADAFEGEGSYFYANGDIYSGAWKAGEKVGAGTFLAARDESQLIGTWAKGQMVTGKWVLKDGTSWHGTFKASQPLGRGVFYFPSGLAQEGEYVQIGEGDGEGDEEALKTVWKGGPVRVANTPAAEILRAN